MRRASAHRPSSRRRRASARPAASDIADIAQSPLSCAISRATPDRVDAPIVLRARARRRAACPPTDPFHPSDLHHLLNQLTAARLLDRLFEFAAEVRTHFLRALFGPQAYIARVAVEGFVARSRRVELGQARCFA